MEVTLLGTAGWMPTNSRETTCVAIREGDELVLVDAGTGLRRLKEPEHAELLAGVGEIHLCLTHFHLDHVCGLAYLPGLAAGRKLTIHAPAAKLTGVDPLQAVAELIRQPYNPRSWSELGFALCAHDGAFELAGHRVTMRAQQHSDTSVAYRFDECLVVATDTIADPATSAFAAGVNLLLHEMWYCADQLAGAPVPAPYRAHSEAQAVADLAAGAEVDRLVFIHLNPLVTEADNHAAVESACRRFTRTSVVADGTTIAL